MTISLRIYLAGAALTTAFYAISKAATGERVMIDSLLLVIYAATWPIWAAILAAALVTKRPAVGVAPDRSSGKRPDPPRAEGRAGRADS